MVNFDGFIVKQQSVPGLFLFWTYHVQRYMQRTTVVFFDHTEFQRRERSNVMCSQ